MTRPRSLQVVAAVALAWATTLAAAPLRAAPRPGLVRWRGGVQVAASPTCSSPSVSYFGGPIVQTPIIVPVMWSSSVNNQAQTSLGQFYADVTESSYWSWLTEYDTVGLSSGYSQAILPGSASATVILTPSRCASSASCSMTDAELQSELVAQIGAGHLPTPSTDCTGNVETIYMVHFPANIKLTGPSGAGTSCTDGGFCAYHGTATYGTSSVPLIYAAVMDTFTGSCATGCGSNATALENQTDTASHELVESVTDPDIGLDTQDVYADPAGWADNDNSCGEVADICDDGSAGDTITVSGRSWVVQEIWSNKQAKCTSSGPATPVCTGTTLSGCRKCSCGDTGKACGGSTTACETANANVLFGACEACTAASHASCGAAACQQSTTPAADDVCTALAQAPAMGNATSLLAALLLLGGSVAASRGRRAA